jgi:hypothetical protein
MDPGVGYFQRVRSLHFRQPGLTMVARQIFRKSFGQRLYNVEE